MRETGSTLCSEFDSYERSKARSDTLCVGTYDIGYGCEGHATEFLQGMSLADWPLYLNKQNMEKRKTFQW